MKSKEIKNMPIILASVNWPPPPEIMKEVSAERMVTALIETMKPELKQDKVGDAEALAYLMPATGEAPLTTEWTNIFLYLSTAVGKRINRVIPDDIKVEELSSWEMTQLDDLKRWIYKKRGGEFKHPVLYAFTEAFKEAKKPQTELFHG